MTPSAAAEPRAVAVLGFHRSGTSMVTRMLNLLGVDLGDEAALLPPEERDNARGYWEPRWMNVLNDELLARLGSSAFAPFRPAAGWERAPELEPLRARARRLLAEHFSDAPVWGFKDPRTSLTLPFWRTVVDRPMAFVVCVRSPADAVASALRRGLTDLHRWHYAERWLDYTSHALSNTAGDDRLIVFYDDALRDPARETRRLAAFLGLGEPSERQLRETVASVDPELRHHMTNALDVAVDAGLPVEVRALYLLLRAGRDLEAAGRDGTADRRLRAAVDRIAVELREAHERERDLHGAHREALAQIERAEQQLREATEHAEELAGAHAELARATAALRDAERLVVERDARIQELERRVAELVDVIAQRDATIDTFARSLSWRITRPLRRVMAPLRAQH